MIKRTLIIGLISFGLSTTMNAQELPAPSPYTEVQQRIGLTDFTLSYSRPGVKDRTIFGDLEAYGEIWRTGANRATKLEVSSDAVIGNAEVAAGVYSIFTIPGEKTWRFILNSDINASENSYDEAKNVIDIEVEAKEGQFRESMLLYFDALRDESAELVFEWENVRWTIPVQVASDELAMQNIDNKIAEIEGNFRVYNSSAKYYLDHGKDLEKALAWSKKSVDIEERFWNVYNLSLIYHAMGNKEMAIDAAKRSLELSMDAEYEPYIKMNKENLAAWGK